MKGISKMWYRGLQLKKERRMEELSRSGLLSSAEPGISVRAIHVIGGDEARRKLIDIGVVPGEVLRVLKNDYEGPVLVSIRGTTLMIGRGLADKVRVVPV